MNIFRTGFFVLIALVAVHADVRRAPDDAGTIMTEQEAAASSAHHTSRGFVNPDVTMNEHSFGDFLRWVLLERNRKGNGDSHLHYPVRTLPDGAARLKAAAGEPFTVTWIGHSTILVRIGGITILTDPVWSDRASPVSWAGPVRHTQPGIALSDLPPVDVVLISHNHYDHLDIRTIRALGNGPLYLAPLGVGAFLERLGVAGCRELDWWESVDVNGIRLTCLPAQHFSSRTMFDRNRTLWCGWAATGEDGRFCFGGDTGYFPGFREIGERLGPFDAAALPIGAYLPRWFMGQIHMGPDEALRAAEDLRTGLMIPVHWGAFNLADDTYDHSPAVLAGLLAQRGESATDVAFMMPGETLVVKHRR